MDISVWQLRQLIGKGKLRAYMTTSYVRPPGTPHAFRRVRLRVSSAELERYLAERTAEYERVRLEGQRRRDGRAGPAAAAEPEVRGAPSERVRHAEAGGAPAVRSRTSPPTPSPGA